MTEEDKKLLVEVMISGLAIDPNSNMPMVLLTDRAQSVMLPIWIGVFEASAIATELEQIQVTRPMTHDLVKNIILGLDGKLLRVEIHDLKANTFFANLVLRVATGEELRVDSRPSDGIALALRFKAPILVSKEILASSGQKVTPAQLKSTARTKEEWTELLKGLSDEAFGKYKM